MAKTYTGTFRVPGGFEVQNPTPPDDRFVVDLDADLLDVNELDNIYEGISVYSKESKSIYVWNGQDRTNSSNWVIQGTSSTPTFQDIIDAQNFGSAQFPSGVQWEDDGDELSFSKLNSIFSISGTRIILNADNLEIKGSNSSLEGKALVVQSDGTVDWADVSIDLSNYLTQAQINSLLSDKQDILAEGEFVDGDKTKLDNIESGAEVNDVNSVNTQTGDVVLDADDISDAQTTNKFTTQADIDRLANTSGTNTGDQDISGIAVNSGRIDDVQDALSGKVDKKTDKAVASGTYTLLASDVDKHLMITAPCTVVVPNGLAGDLEFQGEQVGGDDTDVITFVAESGGTLNVTAAFQAKTDNEFSVFGIRTHGNDVATMYGTLKLAE